MTNNDLLLACAMVSAVYTVMLYDLTVVLCVIMVLDYFSK